MSLETAGSLFVHRHDGFAVTATILVDMLQSLVKGGYGLDGQLVVHELCAETVFCGGLQQRVFAVKGSIGLFVSVDDDVFLGQRFY